MIYGLPQRLKEIRWQRRLSQREVADRLYVSPSLISGYESGERTPSLENFLALSSLYRCSADYLLGKPSIPPDQGLDTGGLTDQQVALLRELIETMRR